MYSANTKGRMRQVIFRTIARSSGAAGWRAAMVPTAGAPAGAWVWDMAGSLRGRVENTMQTGLPLCARVPVGCRRPVCGSMAKVTMLSLSSFSAYRKRPPGAMVKKRGVRPSDGSAATNRSSPLAASMRNTAMLSCPRLEA